MNFLELVTHARSCRRFVEDQPLTPADVDWLLECARLSPSARNAQDLRFITITWGEVCQRLFSITRWAAALKDWNGPHPGERPTAFIAVLMPEKGGEINCIDVGITCQTIQLAAASRGWGACMIHSFDHKKCRQLLNVPEDMKIAILIGLGVEKEIRVVEPMPADGSCAYWRDGNGVHHVPKRGLEELVTGRF